LSYFVRILIGLSLVVVHALALANGERIALIIGNSAYKDAPLVNPKNDAASMSNLLREAGFDVLSLTDGTQEQMKSAVAQFGAKVRAPQAKFALFYYAGHGVQLDWRNYLIPVNAQIRTADDVRRGSVDVSELVDYMQNQKGKSFLVVLDACRDDPFANQYTPPAKGLSQFDAPVGSMLAYSTSPGKVALDGQGSNGLYTSYLVKEMAVKSAKLEDVFKRVRLSVRLASNGMQVPWETTSLEEDVYLFPNQIKQLSEAEQEQVLQRELAAWNAVKDTQDHIALANFIREYPSGSVSELAQSRLSRLLAAQATREITRLVAKSASLATAEAEYKAKLEAAARDAALAAAARDAALKAEEERKLATQAAEKARLEEAQRVAAAKAEQERVLAAQRDAERLAAERARAEKLAQDALAAQNAAAQAAAMAEAERIARQEVEAQRVARERELARAAAEKLAVDAAERSRAEAARVAAAQEAALKAEQARVAAARVEAQREAELQAQAQKALNERLAAAKLEAGTAALPQNLVLASPEIVLAATPYFTAMRAHERRFTVGDSYVQRVTNLFNKQATDQTYNVTKLDLQADRVEYNGGSFETDVMGNVTRNAVGSMGTPRQFYPAELAVGKRWRTMFIQNQQGGFRYTFRYDVKVVAKERITVPAGSFETYRLEAVGYNVQLGARITRTIWVAPGINADIAEDYEVRLRSGQLDTTRRTELVSFKQAQMGQIASR
jgi:uncharacterized caspase-like protein